MTDPNWNVRAKCFGQPITEWVSSSLPEGEPVRSILAQAKCSGCPVFDQCGLETLQNKDIGVIRAGQALVDNRGSELYQQYGKIRERLGMAPVRSDSYEDARAHWPRSCQTCDRPMRPRNETSQDWPHTVSAHNRTTCSSCHYKQWRQENGSLGLPPVSQHSPVCTG